jgi:hypothetical protein
MSLGFRCAPFGISALSEMDPAPTYLDSNPCKARFLEVRPGDDLVADKGQMHLRVRFELFHLASTLNPHPSGFFGGTVEFKESTQVVQFSLRVSGR